MRRQKKAPYRELSVRGFIALVAKLLPPWQRYPLIGVYILQLTQWATVFLNLRVSSNVCAVTAFNDRPVHVISAVTEHRIG